MLALLATVWTQNVDVAFQYEIRRTAPLAFLKGVTLPHSLQTLRSRSPCASWAPPLHRGLVRGSFPAPHHHDPNEMLPNFVFWVMVAATFLSFHLGIFSFFTTLRTQVRPAIEFVSGRKACVHFSGWMTFYCATPLVFVPFKFVYRDTLKIASAPGPFGCRGEMAMAVASSARLAFLRGAVCASTPYTRCCPFVPCTATVH